MKLALLITARCNASCAHCSTSCGPHRTESLSRDRIFRLIDDAAALTRGERLKVYLSGGEPFLDFPLLLDIVRHGKKHGAVMTCVTNASWATSAERARQLLAELKRAGLDSFAISTSRFHRQYIRTARVERALQASRDVGLRCTLKRVHARADALAGEAIRSWARAAGAHDVQDLPLLPHLREGASQPEGEYLRDPGLPGGRCPAALLTVREDGRAYTCCTPGSFNELLRLGDVAQDPLDELRQRFYVGCVQQILRTDGPIAFAREIQARGQGHRLRGAYAGVCDLCTHIATDPVMSAIAAETADAAEIRQIHALVAGALHTPHRSTPCPSPPIPAAN